MRRFTGHEEPWGEFIDIKDELAEAVRQALTNREQVVMVRVNDELLKRLDMLVEAGICARTKG